ncbi:MAG: sialate O-acetylesterase [Verrucomicrobiae bacterium]|nr:sialate O-acetylesterase [Verrucomicrobiae bacterium]
MIRHILLAGLCWTLFTPLAIHAQNKPFVHPLFGNNMVLQRDARISIWGWTTPGKEVSVTLCDKNARATAGEGGKWIVQLDPVTAGGPFNLIIEGPQKLTLSNILVGDVWICAGQSNMEMGITMVNQGGEEAAKADYPSIRLFSVGRIASPEPQPLLRGNWQVCSPATIANGNWKGFSAAAYFFGRHLHQELKIPIGLIQTTWGGTPAESWLSLDAIKTLPYLKEQVDYFEQAASESKRGPANLNQKITEWWQFNDVGSSEGAGWAAPTFVPSLWKTMDNPKPWKSGGLPGFNGIVWFRREIDIPEAWAGKELLLHLGKISSRDTTFFNGVKVGGLEQTNLARDYKIPANLVRKGRNLLALRILDTGGAGGFIDKPEDLKIELPGDTQNQPIPLTGPWLFHETTRWEQTTPYPTRFENNPQYLSTAYNGMIAPLAPSSIKGILWYQGESNVPRAKQYFNLLSTLIKDWRTRFEQPEVPFFIVQLPNYSTPRPTPYDSTWAELREAQALAAKKNPKCALVVTIDIGEPDFHPKNKQDVGKRLALSALNLAYGQPGEASSPAFDTMEIRDKTVRVHFTQTAGGLLFKNGDKLSGFAIADANRKYEWADAVIEGDFVNLSSPKVEKPIFVRYGWAENPGCNLYNKADLPAIPFRSDGPK